MIKYTLLLFVTFIFGFGLWFMSWPGPEKLDFADRFWPGASEAEPLVVRSIQYARHSDQKLDIYIPSAKAGDGKNFPVLLFFYGGSWRDGSRQGYGFLGKAFAARGFITVIADYRKIPDHRFPSFVEDAADATAWTHNNIAEHGGDPNQLYLLGHSAGAHIAMMATLDPQWLARDGLDSSIIKGVIGLAGPYDFLPFTGEAAKEAMGHWPRLKETQPISYARADAPPLLLLSGNADDTVKPRNSKALASAINALHGQAEVKLYPGVTHDGIIMAISRPFRRKAPVIEDIMVFTRKNDS